MGFYQWLYEWWTGFVVMAGGALFVWLSLLLLGEYRRAFTRAAGWRTILGGWILAIGRPFIFRRRRSMGRGQIDAWSLSLRSVRANSALVSDACVAALRAFSSAPQRER